MLTHQEETFLTGREVSFPPLGRVHNLEGRGTVPDQEQSVGELLAAVDSLQRIVSELLMKNQILRMALDNSGETPAFSLPTGSANKPLPLLMQLF